MVFNKRKAILLTVLILLGAAGFLWLRSYVFSNVGVTLAKKIQSLDLSGFNLRYDSLAIDLDNNTVEIDNLLLEQDAYDTTCIYPEFIKVGKVRAEGFRLLPLIFRNILSFEKLYLHEAHLYLRENSLLQLDSAAKEDSDFRLRVDELFFESAHIEYTDSVNCDLITGLKTNLTLTAVKIDALADTLIYNFDALDLDSIRLRMPGAFYTFEVKRVHFDLNEKLFQVDSIQVIPDFGKVEFGRKHGFEIDRFEGVIPVVRVQGLTFSFRGASRISAELAEVEFRLKIFRDKRLPFRGRIKDLPIDQLRSLPIQLALDSIVVSKSFVQYEEFPKEADEPGGIYFNNLHAVITGIHNQSKKGNLTLTAYAALMGQGDINLSGSFPWNEAERSTVKGSLQDFNLPAINPMLMPSTNMKIETGKMEKLTFRFAYNNTRSDGEIEMNYHDLKLITFKDGGTQDEEELEKDNLKTFMMNTFIFRKNMGEELPEEKRTGTVSYTRDDTRSVFNYWIKSLLSGIKSAYNLDKAAEKRSKRLLKRQNRLADREARKLKKAEKKKERG